MSNSYSNFRESRLLKLAIPSSPTIFDYARRLPFVISGPAEETAVISSDDFGSDLPILLPSSLDLGRASQMEIPIIQLDNVNVRSTVTILTS